MDAKSADFKNAIFSIAIEISNNDLKYRFGESHWKLDLLETNQLLLEMQSKSNYRGSTDTGKWHICISHNVENRGGTLEEEINGSIYIMRILFPI